MVRCFASFLSMAKLPPTRTSVVYHRLEVENDQRAERISNTSARRDNEIPSGLIPVSEQLADRFAIGQQRYRPTERVHRLRLWIDTQVSVKRGQHIGGTDRPVGRHVSVRA